MEIQNWMKRFCKLTIATTLFAFTSASCNETEFDSTIPVLDMNEYFDPDTKDKFVADLYDALKEVGFFAVINTGVDPDVLDRGYQSCFDFFSLPNEEKMKSFSLAANGQRGYICEEFAKGSSRADFKEYY